MLQCNLKFYENLDEAKFDNMIAMLRMKAEQGDDEPSVVERIFSYMK